MRRPRGQFVQETWAQIGRWLIHLRREPFNLTFSLVQPLIFLVFLGSAFQPVVGTSVGGDYRTFLLPGVLALTVFGNSLAGGIPLLFDKENGLLARFLVAPVSRASILLSRFVAVNLISTIQCLILLGLGALFGIRIAAGLSGLVGILALGILLGLGFTVISFLLAFVLDGHGDFFAILGTITLPVTFVSSAFVPLAALPGWMQGPALLNPMTYAVDGMRVLVQTGWSVPFVLRRATLLALFDAVVVGLGLWMLRRKLS